MEVSYDYDMDPRYGWVRINTQGRKFFNVVIDTEDGQTFAFEFIDGEMKPTCICAARSENECGCPNYPWSNDE